MTTDVYAEMDADVMDAFGWELCDHVESALIAGAPTSTLCPDRVEARRMHDAADALLDEDGDVTDIEKNHRLNARASSLRVAAEKIRALDPATVGSGS